MIVINAIELPAYPFGQILKRKDSVTSDTWHDFLTRKLVQRARRSQQWLRKDVVEYESKLRLLQKVILEKVRCERKNLVHADFYFNNVLVNDDLEISAVLDFSMHALVGDKRLDAASISFLTLDKYITTKHLEFARNFMLDIYGKEIQKYLDIYVLYYAFYYADTQAFDQDSFKWCLRILNNAQKWQRIDR